MEAAQSGFEALFQKNICSHLRTMARSSTRAVETMPGGHLNWRKSTSRIAQRYVLSSRRMPLRLALAMRKAHPNFSPLPNSAGEGHSLSGYRRWLGPQR